MSARQQKPATGPEDITARELLDSLRAAIARENEAYTGLIDRMIALQQEHIKITADVIKATGRLRGLAITTSLVEQCEAQGGI